MKELEAVIDRGLATFIEVGRALTEIRSEKLFIEAGFKRFDQYVRERFSISRPHAYHLIDAVKVVEAMSPIGDIPKNEAQARELVPLLKEGPDAVRTVWADVQKAGDPTAAAIRSVVTLRSQALERERVEEARQQAGIQHIDTGLFINDLPIVRFVGGDLGEHARVRTLTEEERAERQRRGKVTTKILDALLAVEALAVIEFDERDVADILHEDLLFDEPDLDLDAYVNRVDEGRKRLGDFLVDLLLVAPRGVVDAELELVHEGPAVG